MFRLAPILGLELLLAAQRARAMEETALLAEAVVLL